MSLLQTIIEKNRDCFDSLPPGASAPVAHDFDWGCETPLMTDPDGTTLSLRLTLEDSPRLQPNERHYLSGSFEVVCQERGQHQTIVIPVDAEDDAHELVRDALADLGRNPTLADSCKVLAMINYAESLYRRTCQHVLYSGSNIPC